MDNRVFNINGSGPHALRAALDLAFWQINGYPLKVPDASVSARASGYIEDPEKGLILLRRCAGDIPGARPFLTPLPAEHAALQVYQWLSSHAAKAMHDGLTGWDACLSHDGDNSLGWRVYCEDWGRVAGLSSAIVAITPAFMWHGK